MWAASNPLFELPAQFFFGTSLIRCPAKYIQKHPWLQNTHAHYHTHHGFKTATYPSERVEPLESYHLGSQAWQDPQRGDGSYEGCAWIQCEVLNHSPVPNSFSWITPYLSQSQYETQLNVWENRKNLKVDEWADILMIIDKLDSRYETCRVLVSGHPVPAARIERARRYRAAKLGGAKGRRVAGIRGKLPSSALSFC